jgi:hypothetical protein
LELNGSLKNFSLPDIVQLIGTTRRTGVLVVTVGPDRSSIYFEDGTIIHADCRDLAGQEAINKLFRQKEGKFQFLSDVEAPEKTLVLDWMNVLMEAARLDDESDRDDDFADFDLESAMAGPGEAAAPAGGDKVSAWDPGPVKERMGRLLKDAFGRKANKILKELKKNSGSKLTMLEFCDKAEKFIYVFIDNKQAEEVGRQLRAVIEESLA